MKGILREFELMGGKDLEKEKWQGRPLQPEQTVLTRADMEKHFLLSWDNRLGSEVEKP